MNATADTFTQFESLNDLKNPPTNWEGAMEAVIAGAVDHDEIEPLCSLCCAIADDAMKHRKPAPLQSGYMTFDPPLWSEFLDSMLDELRKASRRKSNKMQAWATDSFLKVGKVADYWIAKKAEVVQ